MIRFGMIGGLGAFASVRLYELINQESVKLNANEIEDSSFPDITIRQVPFRSTDKFGNVNEEIFLEEVGNGLDSLVRSGVTHVSFACNTLNSLFEKAIAENGKLEYISAVSETVKGINAEKGKEDVPLAILTSRNAYQLGVYRDNVLNRPVVEPPQDIVDELIYQSMQGKHLNSFGLFEEANRLILNNDSTTEILLGCTELSVYSVLNSCNKKYDSLTFTAQTIARMHHENP